MHSRPRPSLWPLVGLTLVLSSAASFATSIATFDLNRLAKSANLVVRGTVEEVKPQWSAKHDIIFTDVTIRVGKTYKGTALPGATLTVRREGGTVDGIEMRVFGAASFAVGDELITFIERRGSHDYTVGMAQGKLDIRADSDGKKRVHPAQLANLRLTPNAEPAISQPMLTEEFEARLERAIRDSGR